MDTTALLQSLRDIHEPQAVSWWPLAPGWWLLIGLVVTIITSLVLCHFYRKKTALRKAALSELGAIRSHYQNNSETATIAVRNLSMLLKRLFISKSFANKAGLTGKEWLEFLDTQLHTTEFSKGAGQILETGPYQEEIDAPLDELFDLLERVFKKYV